MKPIEIVVDDFKMDKMDKTQHLKDILSIAINNIIETSPDIESCIEKISKLIDKNNFETLKKQDPYKKSVCKACRGTGRVDTTGDDREYWTCEKCRGVGFITNRS